jgi:hypothetical protein
MMVVFTCLPSHFTKEKELLAQFRGTRNLPGRMIQVATVLTRIRDVLNSNHSQNKYLEILRRFPQSLDKNAGTVRQVGENCFLTQFSHSLIIPPFDNIVGATDSINK